MHIDEFHAYCLTKAHVSSTFPFDKNTLVMKVGSKVFAITGLENPVFEVNLKCDPAKALELREQYPDSIIPGFHMNKKHWNTVQFEAGLSEDLLLHLIDHSYDLVVKKMTRKEREQLGL